VTPPPNVQGDREAGLPVEREPIVVGGTRLLRREVWVSGKPTVIRLRAVHFCTLVDNCKGACGPERGARFSRGERSEGRNPGTVAA
jgi:hypothetical protein